MKKIGVFKVLQSVYISGRGLVLLGDILEGRVKIGSSITFTILGEEISRKVTGVEIADNISTREFRTGLTFMNKQEVERKIYHGVKVEEQIIDIFE